MKKNLFKKLLCFVPAVVATPIIATSCGTINHINFLVNYDNSLDASLALGISPDYYLSNTYKYGENKAYAPYLDTYLNKSLTKVEDLKIYDGQETDLKALSKLQPYTMMVNEWERVDEKQYDGIVPHIAYTSMGDTQDARFNSSDSKETTGYDKDESMTRFYKKDNNATGPSGSSLNSYGTFDYGVSPQKALTMAAKDIDSIYNTGGIFETRAKEINEMTATRIKAITDDEYFKTFLKSKYNNSSNSVATNISTNETTNNITVGIIAGGSKNDSSTFSLLTPNALPLFYSTLDGRGLKFNFPEPATTGLDKNATTYTATFIKAPNNDGETLIKAFTGKFDYLIYYSTIANSESKLNDSSKTEFAKMLKTTTTGQQTQTKDDSSNTNRIYESTYFDIYDPIWGMMGYSHLLDILLEKIIPQFTKNDTITNTQENGTNTLDALVTKDKANRINFPSKDISSTIRKDTDFTKFPSWNYKTSTLISK